jgi:hypothetical protein
MRTMTLSSAAVSLAPTGDEIVIDGPHYLDVLFTLHQRLRPRTYFEVGTWKGASLEVASCASLAVDPNFQLEDGVIGPKPVCILYQLTSDEFFAANDPAAILGAPIDLAFIDALHVFEYALREFIATERSVHKNSVIVLDDPCPRDFYMARRSLVPDAVVPTKYEGYWTGDIWKLIPVLREYRPDIKLTCIDTVPTGLATCTNLDPANDTLSTHYDEITARWRDVSLEDYGMARLLDDLRMESAELWVTSVEALHPDDPPPPNRTRPRPPTQAEVALGLRRDLDDVLNSRSWRVTQPLRWLAGIARGRVRD